MRTTDFGKAGRLEPSFQVWRKLMLSVSTSLRGRMEAAAFDPGELNQALRRDAGIDPCEVERIAARRRPLIR